MICCCLPPERQGGGMTYLNIAISHLTSFSYPIVSDEILQRKDSSTITPASLLISFLCHYRPSPVTGSVFHHFYRFGLCWDSPEGWWGPNWKFWSRKLQSGGNLVISQIVKNVNIKVSVHLSLDNKTETRKISINKRRWRRFFSFYSFLNFTPKLTTINQEDLSLWK